MNLVMTVESEVLSPDELCAISGRARKDDQRNWLNEQGWKFMLNAGGAPIVGRWYARMKMAGVDLATVSAQPRTTPDFSKAK